MLLGLHRRGGGGEPRARSGGAVSWCRAALVLGRWLFGGGLVALRGFAVVARLGTPRSLFILTEMGDVSFLLS